MSPVEADGEFGEAVEGECGSDDVGVAPPRDFVAEEQDWGAEPAGCGEGDHCGGGVMLPVSPGVAALPCGPYADGAHASEVDKANSHHVEFFRGLAKCGGCAVLHVWGGAA